MYRYNPTPPEDALIHYGIKGQKWGVRRYQNKDGSYTNAGKAAKNREKAAEHRRYAEDYNPKNYIGKSKYTDRQRPRDQKKMDRELAKAKEYDAKAKKMRTRQKRSAEHDAKMQSYADQRSTGEALVKTMLATSITMNGRSYKDYMQNQVSGMSKGRAMVSSVLLGDLGAMYMKHRYITQDERKK